MLTKQLTRSPLRTDAVVELRAYASGQLSAYGEPIIIKPGYGAPRVVLL